MLLEIGWIKLKGRRETPGRPVTRATTDTFLEQFGLESCEALPGMEELKAAGLLDARASVATLGAQGTLPGGGPSARRRRTKRATSRHAGAAAGRGRRGCRRRCL